MAALLSQTRHFAKLHACRGFSSIVFRRLGPEARQNAQNGSVLVRAPRRSCTNKSEIATKSEASPSTSTKKAEHSVGIGIADKFHHPSETEKKLLIWAKIYPSMEAIPKTVSHQSILKAKDIMRVYITVGMVIVTSIVAIVILLMSRQARDRGDSLTKRKLEWKKALEEQGRKEREQAAQKGGAEEAK